MTILQAEELTKEYEERSILKKVTVAIRAKEAFALIGPTGSGKTTLIRMLDLLEMPTSGKVYFDNIDVTHNKQKQLHARRRMSYVQQKPVVFSMSVFDNIACGLKWRHENSKLIKHMVNDVLDLVEMGGFKTRNAKNLSGGEIQRVAIARALVTNPEILFLDEPTANLDPISTMKVEKVIHNVIRERKVAVIMATHDMVLGQQLAKRIGVLLDGRLMQVGSPSEIFSSPINQKVAEFVGVENMLSGKVIERNENVLTINVSNKRIQAMSSHLFANEVYVLIRPEDIIFSVSENVSSARNMLRGTISKLIEVGPLIRIEINCGFPLIGLLTRSSASELGLEIGKDIYASFKVTATHVIRRLILKNEEKHS
ncbi:MAG: ABC transporter ATP-binding protein [Dehalococcoidia bacterium]|nr:MAG: ABC transporter ATP-binding protein [Dehalococcoidia bacterium]